MEKCGAGAVQAPFLSAFCEGSGGLPHGKAGAPRCRRQTGSRKNKGLDAAGEKEPERPRPTSQLTSGAEEWGGNQKCERLWLY